MVTAQGRAVLHRKPGRPGPPIFVPYGIEGYGMVMTGVVVCRRGEPREGVARPEFASSRQRKHERIPIMINNSSLTKWQRLSQKQLDQRFTHELVQGLQCSPFEASAILDAVYEVYSPYFETSGTLKPGQILFVVISTEARANTPLAESKQVTVTLWRLEPVFEIGLMPMPESGRIFSPNSRLRKSMSFRTSSDPSLYSIPR